MPASYRYFFTGIFMSEDHTTKNRLRTINQKLVVLFLGFISRLPFWLLYLISGFFYFLVEHVINYRSKVIDENLKFSFPDKSSEERLLLRKRFYRHFCDMMLEAVKLHHISEKQLQKRLSVKNIEVLEDACERNKGVILLAMHHNNWEWGAAIQRYLKPTILMVFNRMRNNAPMDDFLLKTREQWGGEGVATVNSLRRVLSYVKANKPFILWLAADQSAKEGAHYWTSFLNREAPFFAGPIKLAQKLNQPLIFQSTRKVGRGKYEIEFDLLIEKPAKVNEGEILRMYVEKMEEIIHDQPEYYLWSHRRWKHKRPEGVELMV